PGPVPAEANATTSPVAFVGAMAAANERQGSVRPQEFASLPLLATNVRCAVANADAEQSTTRTAIRVLPGITSPFCIGGAYSRRSDLVCRSGRATTGSLGSVAVDHVVARGVDRSAVLDAGPVPGDGISSQAPDPNQTNEDATVSVIGDGANSDAGGARHVNPV